MNYKICFIGAGNLATHLSCGIHAKGYKIIQVFSRTRNSAEMLAKKLETTFTTFKKEITKEADIFFVAVKDDAVHDVLTQIDFSNKLLVHCSGGLPLAALKEYSDKTGVLYPLQTFSKDRKVDFNSVPVFVEANNKENEKILIEIAGKIAGSVQVMDSGKRKSLHIAAVFACNFVNHFYSIAAEYLASKNIPFDVLRPLILETALKVQEMEPDKSQTGPAIRFDENIISSHLKELEGIENYAELYNSISKSIFEHHKKLL